MRNPEQMSEADWRGWIAGTARAHGWLVHTIEEPNVACPNLWLVRDGVVLAIRAKSERSKITDAQQEWQDELAPSPVAAAIWRPSDMPTVFDQLTKQQIDVPEGAAA